MKLSDEPNIQSDSGLIFDIQDFSTQDGPGIRTTIFFKGCPLKCNWCSNPEGQSPVREIMYLKNLCNNSYNCIDICTEKSLALDKEGFIQLNRNYCINCKTFNCTTKCYSGALRISGKYVLSSDIIDKVKSNLAFYNNTGGGVTFSGGEPLKQPEFAKRLLRECKSIGISVGLETCGYFNWNKVRSFVNDFDFIYYDLKIIPLQNHKTVTGKSNNVILSNLKKLTVLSREKIIVTIPVIPGVNNNNKSVSEIIGICKMNGIKKVRMLPFHSYGCEKYTSLGRIYENNGVKAPDVAQLNYLKKIATISGIEIQTD